MINMVLHKKGGVAYILLAQITLLDIDMTQVKLIAYYHISQYWYKVESYYPGSRPTVYIQNILMWPIYICTTAYIHRTTCLQTI